MRPLLRRWLQNCHLLANLENRPWVCKDAREHLESAVIPTTYVSEELTTEFANYWTKIRNDEERLEKIQLNALSRWRTFQFELGKSTESHPLPLDVFMEIFDDYFFLGALRPYTKVSLADDTPANSSWLGLTKKEKQHISSGPPEIHIQIKRLPKQLWTRRLIQEFLDTLLHEMTHAFLMIYTAAEGYRRMVETEGLTGHGPCWVKVAAAVAAEADRSLGGLWEKWSLKISDALLSERAELRKLHDCQGDGEDR